MISALMVAGLLFVLWIQLSPQQQPVELPRDSAPLQDNRTIPDDQLPPPPQVSRPAPRFGGYACIGDCSEDKAGYRWAEQNGITDPDACTGKSGSFIEGCRVYARQQNH